MVQAIFFLPLTISYQLKCCIKIFSPSTIFKSTEAKIMKTFEVVDVNLKHWL